MLGSLKGWFTALSTIGKVGVIMGASIVGLGTAGAISGSPQTPKSPEAPVTTPAPAPKVEHKTITTTEAVAFETQTVDDSTIAAGTDQVLSQGVNGVKTKTWDVTTTNGIETNRTLVKEEVTTQPIAKVVHHGTYVAPSCPNGTYVNTAGNTVCSPYSSPSAPSGATALCADGTYSFSQSRSGTCSHHGGVSQWL